MKTKNINIDIIYLNDQLKKLSEQFQKIDFEKIDFENYIKIINNIQLIKNWINIIDIDFKNEFNYLENINVNNSIDIFKNK